MYLKFMTADLIFDELYLETATVCSWLTMLDAPFVGLLRDCFHRKLLEQGQFPAKMDSSYSFEFLTLQVIQRCKDW